jgi:hypothetical protein
MNGMILAFPFLSFSSYVVGSCFRDCRSACAFVLAVTALVSKQFWRPGDFWSSSDEKVRVLALARPSSHLLRDRSIAFVARPTIQSHPYRLTHRSA